MDVAREGEHGIKKRKTGTSQFSVNMEWEAKVNRRSCYPPTVTLFFDFLILLS